MPHRVPRTYTYETHRRHYNYTFTHRVGHHPAHRYNYTLTLRFGQDPAHNRMLFRYARTNWGRFANRDLHKRLADLFPEAYEDYRQTGDFVPYVLYPDIDDFTSDRTRRLILTLRRQRLGASSRGL